MSDPAVAALGFISETRDPYLNGHQSRVGLLGGAIALRMGMSQSMATLVQQGGEFHDIGKVVVPIEVLSRTGKLGNHEFEIVKRHAQIGGEILALAEAPWPMSLVAAQHHERLDGSGYPDGLSGDDIIMPARIIAVADVVEAMSGHRPYRAALGVDAALDEIKSGAGIRFDMDVVEACIMVFEDGFSFTD